MQGSYLAPETVRGAGARSIPTPRAWPCTHVKEVRIEVGGQSVTHE